MKLVSRRILLTGLLLSMALAALPTRLQAAPKSPKRSIKKISGDLYRFQNNFHFSVFFVTADGIVVADPINKGAASWLKGELKKRFNKPVKYLIYSHDHQDHISGGEVFADTATVIAHKNAKADIVGEKRPTATPDITFSDKMTLSLGGKQIELTYVGKSHSDNMVVMRFPAERTLYACDFVAVKSVGFKKLSDAYLPEWIDAIKVVEGLDFDTLATCHGKMGKMSDVKDQRGFYEDLYGAVLKAAQAGKSLEEMKASIKLEKYKSWGRYKNYLPLNVEGVYNQLKLHRRPTRHRRR
ncbi:MAG: MBL fold metallo-hydrolase [Nitrospinaceae bacterium]|jgi:glyoxylase-like metal-dependent hydrolase (beta-lactamase superfamily II)|nr:MBL fold metallo-hydrolase [Nitrospinaceae bacterium]MBT3435190.1 MBL fold metallo-hydrolase [Nitrospinaceae bacterium]MBT3821463.1 MBL fold metallo-hydrolase [Nitrospinaceae bacterium]MBT4430032.1 MBL fold metallo-hydrolase [Nitrospinaceae bacterium]MBT5367268.1 MBL fold metallo-hydrolase [Nitrospinaceae bacterium]